MANPSDKCFLISDFYSLPDLYDALVPMANIWTMGDLMERL